jgi:hypothetical protein
LRDIKSESNQKLIIHEEAIAHSSSLAKEMFSDCLLAKQLLCTQFSTEFCNKFFVIFMMGCQHHGKSTFKDNFY